MKVITRIQGGLGNQLFQYAAGKAISLRYKAELFVDASWYNTSDTNTTPRDFLLSKLNLEYKLDNQKINFYRPSRWRRIFQNHLPLNPFFLKDISEYQFNPKVFNLNLWKSQNIYMTGYWQSYRYFESIRELLLKQIITDTKITNYYQAFAQKIEAMPSTMVHIRRGDYISSSSASKIHGFIGLNYYQIAMGRVLEQKPDTHFFIFSDDMEWAYSNIPHGKNITYVKSSLSDTASIEELILMTKCRHHIVANSSLSWWGAWLSNSDTPLIICPNQWTKTHEQNWDDLLPNSWIKISC